MYKLPNSQRFRAVYKLLKIFTNKKKQENNTIQNKRNKTGRKDNVFFFPQRGTKKKN